MSTWIRDLRHTVRQLWRQPIFTLTAVLTLGIGLGVNTVAFTVVNGLLLKGSEVDTDLDIGRLATLPGGDESGYASLAEYERFGDAVRSSLDLAAEGRLSVAWQRDSSTETAWVLFVSSNYFSLVTPEPIAGRLEVAGAAGGPPSVVIGERFWREKLSSPSLAGLTLRLNDTLVNVAGVLPESFHGPAGIYSPDVWLPLDDVSLFRTSTALRKRDARWLFLFGRVRPGSTVPEVQGRVAAAVDAMARDWPDTHRGRTARFRLFREGNSELRALGTAATVAMGIIGLVLLLACFNVTNLLLARAVERERDMAIRAAIGASAARLMRLVVTEGLIVAALAALAALVLASFTQTLIGSFAIPIDQPQHIDLSPDGTVVAFVVALALVAGVLPGLWPAVSAARVDVLRVLGGQGGRAAGGRPTPMRRWLVGGQIAGSTAFLAIAALFAQAYATATLRDLGFAQSELLVAEVEPASHGYDADRSERYVRALMSRVRSLPGVVDVAVADRAPFFIGYERLTAVAAPSSPCEPASCPKHSTLAVDAGYFETMGVALAAGREFLDGASAGEVIINQPLARLHWPDGGGIGETLRIGDQGTPMTVVGIAATTRTRSLDRERPTLYLPIGRGHFERELTVVVRTAIAPELLVRPFTEAADAIDSAVALRSAKPMASRVAVQLWPFRTISWLFSICGGLALVLATVGLAGVVIHAANRRMREFGIRVSVGARPRDLLMDVLSGSARLLVPGLVVGMLLAAGAARLLQSAFVGVNVLNPTVYAAVAVIQALVVLCACISPALRAARTDPLVALRGE